MSKLLFLRIHSQRLQFLISRNNKKLSKIGTINTVHYHKASKDPFILYFWETLLQEYYQHSSLSSKFIDAERNQSTAFADEIFATIRNNSLILHHSDDVNILKLAQTISSKLDSPVGNRNGDISSMITKYLRPSIANIVGAAARSQSVKGIITAGPYKAITYIAAKVSKMLKR